MDNSFIFNGINSETYGIICVYFDQLERTYSAGCQTETNLVMAQKTNTFNIQSNSYTEPISFKMQIINIDGSDMTSALRRRIRKWLKMDTMNFHLLQMNGEEYSGIQYFAKFSNPNEIVVSGVVGLEYTVTTNAPFGFSPVKKERFTITDTNKSKTIFINNDCPETMIYPSFEITVATAGNLEITNSSEENSNLKFKIENCSKNEKLAIDCELPKMGSSTGHNAYSDWNKNPVILKDGKNTLTFNLPCQVVMEYREPRTGGVH